MEVTFLGVGSALSRKNANRYAHQSCSLIFHDCQLFETGDNNRLGVHASYQQLKQLPDDIRRKMWLYHYGDTPLPNASKDGFAGFVTGFQSFTL